MERKKLEKKLTELGRGQKGVKIYDYISAGNSADGKEHYFYKGKEVDKPVPNRDGSKIIIDSVEDALMTREKEQKK